MQDAVKLNMTGSSQMNINTKKKIEVEFTISTSDTRVDPNILGNLKLMHIFRNLECLDGRNSIIISLK